MAGTARSGRYSLMWRMQHAVSAYAIVCGGPSQGRAACALLPNAQQRSQPTRLTTEPTAAM